ncbi:NAD(P)H-dependent glycerol-3-phosphate dehydrogenase [Vagococcus coleopterorum]|uniref:Glycerol-3-phosphate dehydrogenase [NAD(P)+] n=1 Tax=Vagococcus coleopterorum TaxID=2714946 RepID=A0A6G8AP14_9ENTE|nr:NAD(P)H-dependent glycerol-3-phosphate dehydrogenase [Vagococcus coleopterorum]QIL46663.1 NAD(P)H-dependent glycerol-3-phosphate dehydrogenase [Vagococcus coleopterorum]
MQQKIAVLGPGSWGTALAKSLVENGHDVRLWSHKEEPVQEINNKHTNEAYLKGIELPKELKATSNMAEAVADVDAVLFVVPTKAIRSVAKQLVAVLETKPVIIHASKGFEQETHKRISEILEEEIPSEKRQNVVVLSGPSHAEELAVRDITTVTAACEDLEQAKYVQDLFMNDYFRIYTNTDVLGVETGAALKNIIALGSGAIHGLGFGDNAKAALMTRGLAEISRLGVAMGADPLTFIGLSGVGDLIVTCTSVHSRNWRAGDLLGKGHNLDEILENMGMIVEGVSTTKAAYELAQDLNVDMPITETIYNVIYKGQDVKEAVRQLMLREGRSE